MCGNAIIRACAGSGRFSSCFRLSPVAGRPRRRRTADRAANTTTITITSAGVSATQINITPGARVTFVNMDIRSHNMTSDPHPEHNDCSEINTVGLLQPGQSRETGNMVTVRTCGFHDHDDPPPGGAKWAGRITIR